MAKFKVGDRVRIFRRQSTVFGSTGVIWRIAPWAASDHGVRVCGYVAGEPAYSVSVDGIGRKSCGMEIAFSGHELVPLVNPDELAWIAFKSQHLTPDPALILAKEVA